MANDLYDLLLRKLVQLRNSDVNYKTAKEDLWKLVMKDPDTYLEMFFHNWFNHNWTRDQNAKAFPASAPARPYSRKKETLAETRERRKQDANLRGVQLLNCFLPDGETRLKDATGAVSRKSAQAQRAGPRNSEPTRRCDRQSAAGPSQSRAGRSRQRVSRMSRSRRSWHIGTTAALRPRVATTFPTRGRHLIYPSASSYEDDMLKRINIPHGRATRASESFREKGRRKRRIERARRALDALHDGEYGDVMIHFCRACGGPPGCQCWNDE